MKKKFKKIASLVLAVVMAFAMAVPAMASGPVEDLRDETFKIAVNAGENDTEGNHTYTAYQIFTGDVSVEDGKETLSNIKWSKDVDGDAILDLFPEAGGTLDGLLELWAGMEARTIAQTLMDADPPVLTTGTELVFDPGAKKYSADGMAGGYYLIVDKLNDDGIPGEAVSSYIVEVANNVDVDPKSSVPSVDKQVQDDGDVWDETADHEINEKFQFKLKAEIPIDEDLQYYSSYELTFKDVMSAGLTFDQIDSVKINGKDVTNYTTKDDSDSAAPAAGYEALTGKAGLHWSLTIEDIKSLAGDDWGKAVITVEVVYTAHLNEKAKVTIPGGSGISDDDNFNKVTLEYSNNPETDGKGETVEDTVYVFTYDLPSTKYDGATKDAAEKKPLEGAEFDLYVTGDGPDGKTKVKMSQDMDGYYYPDPSAAGEGVKITSDKDGHFNLKGLDEGTYYLRETKAPAGYNLLNEDIEIKVEAKHSEPGGVTDFKRNVPSITDGSLEDIGSAGENAVYNNKGATLPETGGIGTTIFYVVGSVLVLAAVVLLVTKRRMNSK